MGTGIGLSGAIRYAILRGQKHRDEDVKCFTSTTVLLAGAGILLTAGIFAVLDPLLRLFGAEGEICRLMEEYIRVVAVGALLQIFATGLVPFIRNLGGSSFAMFTMIAGFLTNIVLDYLLVWKLGQGMAGAAWATVIGQGVTMATAIGYLAWKKIGLMLPGGREFSKHAGIILRISVAPFGLVFSSQITTILMNRALMLHNGERAVAVYGCIAYIIAIIYLLLQGVGDGSQPLISRYYGEGNPVLLKQVRKYAYLTSGAIALFYMAAVFLLRGHIGLLFGRFGGNQWGYSRLSALVFDDAAASGLCPDHDGLAVCHREGGAVLHPGLCGAGGYLLSASGTAADPGVGDAGCVAGCAGCADGDLGHFSGGKKAGGWGGSALNQFKGNIHRPVDGLLLRQADPGERKMHMDPPLVK